MATPNTQHPSQGTTYSTASNAGRETPLNDEKLNNKKPLRDDIDEEQDEDFDADEEETQNKDWK